MNQNSISNYIQSKLNELNIQGKQDETLAQLNKNIENNKSNIYLYMKKTQLLAQLGKLQEIIHTWDLGILNNIHDINFYQEKGKTYFPIQAQVLRNQGKQDQLIQLYEFAIAQNVNDVSFYQLKCRELFEQQRYTEILECWDQGIKNNKEHKIFYIQKINSIKNFYTLHNGLITDEGWRKIAECWNAGILNNINDYSFYLEKVQALEQLGEYQEILACLDLGLKHNKYQLLLYKKKGQILEKMGKYQEIIDTYDKAIGIMKHPAIYEEKANALAKQQKWQELIEFCNSDKQKEWNYFFLVKSSIQALSELERQDQIIKLCDEHIHRNDMFIYKAKGQIIIQNLAKALFKQGLLEQTIQSWDEAIRINNNAQEYYIEKINALNEQNRYPEALQICNHIMNLELPNQMQMQNLKLNILEKQGNFREALKISRMNESIRKTYYKEI